MTSREPNWNPVVRVLAGIGAGIVLLAAVLSIGIKAASYVFATKADLAAMESKFSAMNNQISGVSTKLDILMAAYPIRPAPLTDRAGASRRYTKQIEAKP